MGNANPFRPRRRRRYELDGNADGSAVNDDIMDNPEILANVDPTFSRSSKRDNSQNNNNNNPNNNSNNPAAAAADIKLPAELVLTDILRRLRDHWKLSNVELLYFWNQFCKFMSFSILFN